MLIIIIIIIIVIITHNGVIRIQLDSVQFLIYLRAY
jgi:hypothetical protein